MNVIEVKNVSKIFNGKTALKNVSLRIFPNKIYGLLGRNGAGKTTLLNTITNKIFADEGQVFIDGEIAVENHRAQSKVFHMTGKNLYPIELKVNDGFKWTREFYPDFNLEYAYELARKYELDINKKLGGLSTGYNTIFKLIQALSANTSVVIYDEPVSGLDANYRELFYKDLIANYLEHPKTIILSTHLVAEISTILEQVIIIKKGEIILDQPVDEILQTAYTVSGDSLKVDEYIRGKNVIKAETIGKLKIASIYQSFETGDYEAIKRLDLKTASLKLQDLVISLTN